MHAAREDFVNTSNPVTLSTDESVPIKIAIIDDNNFELTESFFVKLSFHDQETLPPGVTLNQTAAQVMILDNDGEFSVPVYINMFFDLHFLAALKLMLGMVSAFRVEILELCYD